VSHSTRNLKCKYLSHFSVRRYESKRKEGGISEGMMYIVELAVEIRKEKTGNTK
jgi:hypothetical protein